MSKFRHGFKAEAEYYAELYRKELNLESHDPLCPWELAAYLDVPVRGLSTHPAIPKDVKKFWLSNSENTFSGLIINDGTYKEIVHNDAQIEARQISNIFHEIAHIALGHPLFNPILPSGERDYNQGIEDEARWFGATLMLPKTAIVYIILQSLSKVQIEKIYGASNQMFQFRVNVTDAVRAASNIRRKYG